jgi:protein phosphatase 1 regulatory subunit 10
MLTAIRPLLQANAFSGAGAVATLATRLFDYGAADVDAATRMEILTKIRDGAGNHYFRAWVENPTAVDITREWLKAAFTASREGGDDAQLGETIMPLLHVSVRRIVPIMLC